MNSSYFIGWACAVLWLPRISDVIGRQRVYQVGAIVTALAYGAIFLINNIYGIIAMMGIIGFFSAIRVSVGYVYMMEFVPL